MLIRRFGMLELIACFFGVLCCRFVAHSQVDSNLPLHFEFVFNQLPQGYAISDGELRSVYAVTGSLTEPLVFPPIKLTLKVPNNSSHSVQTGESSFGSADLVIEPGVLLTSCFFKGPDVEVDIFEEGTCLRWLHPVGVYNSVARRRIAKVTVPFQFKHLGAKNHIFSHLFCSAWSSALSLTRSQSSNGPNVCPKIALAE